MIPQTQNEKEFLERIQKLESKAFDGTYEENYKGSPREQAESISNDDEKPHHLGEHTEETAKQRITSFYQNYDKNSKNSLHGNELLKYHNEARIIEHLVQKYHLQQLQQELIHK